MPAGGMAVAAMRGIDNIPMGNAPGESEPICLQRFGAFAQTHANVVGMRQMAGT